MKGRKRTDDGDRHGSDLVDNENLLRVTATSDGYEPELRARATATVTKWAEFPVESEDITTPSRGVKLVAMGRDLFHG